MELSRTLTTEGVDERFSHLDEMTVGQLARVMNDADRGVPEAVERALPQIIPAIEAIAERFAAGGRIIYVGAGTSGRLGVLDASECPPTFNTSPDQVLGLIAGGDVALRSAMEGAEDDADQGAADVAAVGVGERDAVVGIASSGRTPYVIGALRHARSVGALSVALSCNADAETSAVAEHGIEVVVGPEVVAGSTRLRSGTAQKLVLNMISTITMVRAGKVMGNRMVDLRATNEKLRIRAVRMVAELAEVDENVATGALEASDWRVKEAILTLRDDQIR
ncbi:N-acetylmuramic acid 6-phosphate etherase [Tessaracoccus antarcticus]|uniref:N-acetylmuramic acid 6-phosphate etherase n=1 Tax=Tessaracoccus antarcticus TaxID=2479848 RepID=A0A3M0GKR4_9ACTN|nr:N-acetylmuramic acid 6-phosphate etherase [Tessaracoccus antarcticus]RMB61739.1 N-acetylmuramic acid 6-phosphate etherase [Tessaracoccus antarcticus]